MTILAVARPLISTDAIVDATTLAQEIWQEITDVVPAALFGFYYYFASAAATEMAVAVSAVFSAAAAVATVADVALRADVNG